jgi:drug/metabolite transporter (DMT)-like permease
MFGWDDFGKRWLQPNAVSARKRPACIFDADSTRFRVAKSRREFGVEKRSLVFGYGYGLLGVAAFSLTVPATRAAVQYLPADLVGSGRGLAAALCAAVLLFALAEQWPTAAQRRRLWIVTAGVVIGFPWLSAIALQRVPASHGAVVLGILPLATAVAAVLRAGERPSRAFWIAGLAGSAGIWVFSLQAGGGTILFDDLLLLAAVILGAFAYAEGGRLAREMGGWQVISWALVMGAPLLTIPTVAALLRGPIVAPLEAWLLFAFLALVPQWLGFFAWYRAMALIGVARAGQIQLLQIFLSLSVAALWLGEPLAPETWGFALWTVATIVLGQRARVRQQSLPQ